VIKSTRVILAAVLLLTVEAIDGGARIEAATSETLAVRLQKKIETERRRDRFTCREELICGVTDLPLFYARRGFAPAWMPTAAVDNAQALVAALQAARRDGLQVEDYHLSTIELLLEEVKLDRLFGLASDPGLVVDLDLLLTDAFLLVGSHLLAGRVNPETIHSEWVAFNPEADLARTLETALANGTIEASLNQLRPPHPGYAALRKALERYRGIEADGGWPLLPRVGVPAKTTASEHNALLRQRLSISGDLSPTEGYAELDHFDAHLQKALRRFQLRQGLPQTGRLDEQTLEELNVPAAARIRQIELNLERWRWIPHHLGRRYLLVNAADYRLAVVEDGQTRWDMRVVVGKHYRKTPVFSADLQYLELNPYWNVPQTIAVNDILPKVKKDPAYLVRKEFKVFENWRPGASEIDPLTIDWSRITKNNFRFKLRREPGPLNDLGRIKFIMPNRFAVYLHDTPNRKLFAKNFRHYSSGCIRLEKPIELAEYLLREDPGWTRRDIRQAIDSARSRVVYLKEPVPVHLLYWTAWVDEDGVVNFRKDIYRRDPPLDLALRQRPPRVESEALTRMGGTADAANRLPAKRPGVEAHVPAGR
jgi:murein L,D-transpeptidase YcbB/YkuD